MNTIEKHELGKKEEVPKGYRLLDKYEIYGGILKFILFFGSISLCLIFGWILIKISNVIHEGFNGFSLLNRLLFESEYMPNIYIMLIALLIVCIYGFIHEAIHGAFYWIFSHKRPNFGIKQLNPYTALALGAFCSRNKAVIATVGPLVIITFAGVLSWLFVSKELAILAVVFILSINIATALSDVLQVCWISRHSRKTIFGFDGTNSVLYEPIDA